MIEGFVLMNKVIGLQKFFLCSDSCLSCFLMLANESQLKIMEFLTSYGRKMAKD